MERTKKTKAEIIEDLDAQVSYLRKDIERKDTAIDELRQFREAVLYEMSNCWGIDNKSLTPKEAAAWLSEQWAWIDYSTKQSQRAR